MKKKEKSKGNEKLYLAALNNIFDAMKGIRMFERFGFSQAEDNGAEPKGAFVVKEFKEWDYDIRHFDWVDSEGNKLVDFQPEAKLLDLLENKIDLDLE